MANIPYDKKADGSAWKSNILIEAAPNSSKYTGLWSSNPKQEFRELDVSAIDKNTSVVPGTIMMFHGSKIPDHWVLCDGKNGTPNLVDYFVQGTTTEHKKTGGSHDTPLVSHSHTITFGATGNHYHNFNPGAATTSKRGNHTHTMEKDAVTRVGCCGCCCASSSDAYSDWLKFSGGLSKTTKASSKGGKHAHSVNPGVYNCDSKGSHKHRVTIGSKGSGTGAGQNRPPFYTLMYIQKT